MGEDALEAIYEHVSEAEDLYEIWKNIEGATENYADLLGGLEGLMRFDENNPLFNFMDQDPAEGLTKSFDSMVKSIDAVKGAF
jgi:hypothetical protein